MWAGRSSALRSRYRRRMRVLAQHTVLGSFVLPLMDEPQLAKAQEHLCAATDAPYVDIAEVVPMIAVLVLVLAALRPVLRTIQRTVGSA